MKISKLFHWLYAFLMVLPFVALAFNFVRFSFSGTLDITSFEDVLDLIVFPQFLALSNAVRNVYSYGVFTLFGINGAIANLITNALTYWTCVSILYLIFDVIMYVPLLVHRWIDKAVIE